MGRRAGMPLQAGERGAAHTSCGRRLPVSDSPRPCRGSTAAGRRAATANPNTARQFPARCQSPRNSRSCACGNSCRAAMTGRPSVPRSTACTHPRRKRRSQPPSARSAADRKRRARASVVFRPRSPLGRLEPPASRRIDIARPRPNHAVQMESARVDFVNGLLGLFSVTAV